MTCPRWGGVVEKLGMDLGLVCRSQDVHLMIAGRKSHFQRVIPLPTWKLSPPKISLVCGPGTYSTICHEDFMD